MTLEEVVKRLEDHFRVHDDGRPTPYLDDAVLTMFAMLDYCKLFIDKFGSLEEALDAEKVVRCDDCYHYDSENLLCHRYGLEKPVLMIDQGFCSCGIRSDVMNAILEKCRADGGWCTPGIIVTADEAKRILKYQEGCCHDKQSTT